MRRERIHVVAGVLVDGAGRILVQRRADGAHLGGLWEFPGGKLEPGEDRQQGLVRELAEELGIDASHAEPLICVPHEYRDKSVLLDVWRVLGWRGEVHGREGQPLRWVEPAALRRLPLPAADRPVLGALDLPAACLVTPAPIGTGRRAREAWLDGLAASVAAGASLVQIRAPGLPRPALLALAAAAVARCRDAARVLVNGDPALAVEAGAHGVHLDSRRLWQLRSRPLSRGSLVGASCHDAADLARAAALDLDFALLGPVAATPTHPGAVALGWRAFEALVARAALPVYALGGMSPATIERARRAGGQGVAAIRGLWAGTAVSAPAA